MIEYTVIISSSEDEETNTTGQSSLNTERLERDDKSPNVNEITQDNSDVEDDNDSVKFIQDFLCTPEEIERIRNRSNAPTEINKKKFSAENAKSRKTHKKRSKVSQKSHDGNRDETANLVEATETAKQLRHINNKQQSPHREHSRTSSSILPPSTSPNTQSDSVGEAIQQTNENICNKLFKENSTQRLPNAQNRAAFESSNVTTAFTAWQNYENEHFREAALTEKRLGQLNIKQYHGPATKNLSAFTSPVLQNDDTAPKTKKPTEKVSCNVPKVLRRERAPNTQNHTKGTTSSVTTPLATSQDHKNAQLPEAIVTEKHLEKTIIRQYNHSRELSQISAKKLSASTSLNVQNESIVDAMQQTENNGYINSRKLPIQCLLNGQNRTKVKNSNVAIPLTTSENHENVLLPEANETAKHAGDLDIKENNAPYKEARISTNKVPLAFSASVQNDAVVEGACQTTHNSTYNISKQSPPKRSSNVQNDAIIRKSNIVTSLKTSQPQGNEHFLEATLTEKRLGQLNIKKYNGPATKNLSAFTSPILQNDDTAHETKQPTEKVSCNVPKTLRTERVRNAQNHTKGTTPLATSQDHKNACFPEATVTAKHPENSDNKHYNGHLRQIPFYDDKISLPVTSTVHADPALEGVQETTQNISNISPKDFPTKRFANVCTELGRLRVTSMTSLQNPENMEKKILTANLIRNFIRKAANTQSIIENNTINSSEGVHIPHLSHDQNTKATSETTMNGKKNVKFSVTTPLTTCCTHGNAHIQEDGVTAENLGPANNKLHNCRHKLTENSTKKLLLSALENGNNDVLLEGIHHATDNIRYNLSKKISTNLLNVQKRTGAVSSTVTAPVTTSQNPEIAHLEETAVSEKYMLPFNNAQYDVYQSEPLNLSKKLPASTIPIDQNDSEVKAMQDTTVTGRYIFSNNLQYNLHQKGNLTLSKKLPFTTSVDKVSAVRVMQQKPNNTIENIKPGFTCAFQSYENKENEATITPDNLHYTYNRNENINTSNKIIHSKFSSVRKNLTSSTMENEWRNDKNNLNFGNPMLNTNQNHVKVYPFTSMVNKNSGTDEGMVRDVRNNIQPVDLSCKSTTQNRSENNFYTRSLNPSSATTEIKTSIENDPSTKTAQEKLEALVRCGEIDVEVKHNTSQNNAALFSTNVAIVRPHKTNNLVSSSTNYGSVENEKKLGLDEPADTVIIIEEESDPLKNENAKSDDEICNLSNEISTPEKETLVSTLPESNINTDHNTTVTLSQNKTSNHGMELRPRSKPRPLESPATKKPRKPRKVPVQTRRQKIAVKRGPKNAKNSTVIIEKSTPSEDEAEDERIHINNEVEENNLTDLCHEVFYHSMAYALTVEEQEKEEEQTMKNNPESSSAMKTKKSDKPEMTPMDIVRQSFQLYSFCKGSSQERLNDHLSNSSPSEIMNLSNRLFGINDDS